MFRDGSPYADAISGDLIDVSHPLVEEWLRMRAEKDPYSKPGPPPPKKPPFFKEQKFHKPPPPQPEPPAEKTTRRVEIPSQPEAHTYNVVHEVGAIKPSDIEQYEHMTVRQMVAQFGTVDGFKRYLESLRIISDLKKKDLETDVKRGVLIERDYVKGVLLPLYEVAFKRLTSDVPAALTSEVIALVESGGDNVAADVKKAIHDANSRALKMAKQAIDKC